MASAEQAPILLHDNGQAVAALLPVGLYLTVADALPLPIAHHITDISSVLRRLQSSQTGLPVLIRRGRNPIAVLIPLDLYVSVADDIADELSILQLRKRLTGGDVIRGSVADLAEAAGMDKGWRSGTDHSPRN